MYFGFCGLSLTANVSTAVSLLVLMCGQPLPFPVDFWPSPCTLSLFVLVVYTYLLLAEVVRSKNEIKSAKGPANLNF